MAVFPIPSFLENQSVDEVHKKMLDQLPTNIDKSEGGHPWNLTRPHAYHAAYFAEFVIVEAIKLIFPKYAEDYADVMVDHAEMRGLVRKAATSATGKITITGDAGTEIPANTPFSTASINGEPAVEFVTTEATVIPDSGTVTVDIISVEAGMIGNVPKETIILKANKITGIKDVTNPEETSGGTEAESIESLQLRIMEYDASQGVSFVGSEADYKRWAMEVNGIGNAIVMGSSDDSGLVTIILTDANGAPANEELCESVYNHIMRPDSPTERLTPINGCNLVVKGPDTIEISITVTIEPDGTVANETIKKNILDGLKEYLVEATAEGKVRYTKIGSIVSEAPGVEDYNSLYLNGTVSNIEIRNHQLPTVDEENLHITFGENLIPDTGGGGAATQEEIEEAFIEYLEEYPLETHIKIDQTLKVYEDGTLGVNTTENIAPGNQLSVTANAVNEQVGNIDSVLDDL